MKKIILFFITSCFTLNIWASDFEINGISYKITSSTIPYTVEVTNKLEKLSDYPSIITIPNSVTYNNINYSVTSIGNHAFLNCIEITSINIPNSVTSIQYGAFNGCSGLKSIYAYPTTPIILNNSSYVFNGVDKTNCILYVPDNNSVSLYKEANQWKDFENIVKLPNTAVASAFAENIKLYPNPVTNGFNIEGLNGVSNISIIDINGKTVLKKNISGNQYINISYLPKGMYFILINNNGETIKKQIIKN